MGGLTSRINLAWRRSRGGWSAIDFSVLMGLFVSLSSTSGIGVAGWSNKDGAAGDVEGGTTDPRRVIRGQEQGGVGNVIGCAKTLDRMAVAQLFLDRLRYLLLIAFGQDRLGGEAVDPDAIGSCLGGQLFGEHLDARFGGGVGQWRLGCRTAGGGRRHRDDGAAVAVSHPGQEGLEGQEGGGEIGVDRCSATRPR